MIKERNIAVFTNTRAEYGLLRPVLRALQKSAQFNLVLIVGGSHLSKSHGMTVNEIEADSFSIEAKIDFLQRGDDERAVISAMSQAMLLTSELLVKFDLDLIVLLGDRYESLAIAQTALIHQLPLAHIHGGELSEGAYDDAIRHSISQMAQLHFCSSVEHRQRLLQLGCQPESVFNVGALGLENIRLLREQDELMTRADLEEFLEQPLKDSIATLTYHAATASSENSLSTAQNILMALEASPKIQIIITASNADNGGEKLNQLWQDYASKNPKRVIYRQSLGMRAYLSLLAQADLAIGNSSSLLLEAASFPLAIVNVGERQSARQCSQQVQHCDTDKDAIELAIDKALQLTQKGNFDNPFGSGHCSEKIMEVLELEDWPLGRKFYDFSKGEALCKES